VIKNAFGGDLRLEGYCGTLLSECQRLYALASLEGREHLAETRDGEGIAGVSKPFTMRAKVVLLNLLVFDRLDLPTDLIKERVLEFFHPLIGGNKKNLRDVLSNPTKHKGTHKSMKYLCGDLHQIRSQLEKLGQHDKVERIMNEIDQLTADIENE